MTSTLMAVMLTVIDAASSVTLPSLVVTLRTLPSPVISLPDVAVEANSTVISCARQSMLSQLARRKVPLLLS